MDQINHTQTDGLQQMWSRISNEKKEAEFSKIITKQSDALLINNEFNGGGAMEKTLLFEEMIWKALRKVNGRKTERTNRKNKP